MNLIRLLQPKICICILLLIPARAITQGSQKDIFIAINTPGLFYLGDISKYAENSIGISFSSRISLGKKVAVIPTIRYDNFKYKPLDKRVGDYGQFKIGVSYFDNLAGKGLGKLLHDSTIMSYSLFDCGLGIKLNRKMIGNKGCFAYSIGYGVKKACGRRVIIDFCYGWVNLKLASGITASWLDNRIGLGYQFGK